jgi:hypothetical protein
MIETLGLESWKVLCLSIQLFEEDLALVRSHCGLSSVEKPIDSVSAFFLGFGFELGVAFLKA